MVVEEIRYPEADTYRGSAITEHIFVRIFKGYQTEDEARLNIKSAVEAVALSQDLNLLDIKFDYNPSEYNHKFDVEYTYAEKSPIELPQPPFDTTRYGMMHAEALSQQKLISAERGGEGVASAEGGEEGNENGQVQKLSPDPFIWWIIGLVIGTVAYVAIKNYVTGTYVPKVGTIMFISSPTGAKIFLDGIDTGKKTNDSILSVSTGDHYWVLTLAGQKDLSGKVTVVENETVEVKANFPTALGLSSSTLAIGAIGAIALYGMSKK